MLEDAPCNRGSLCVVTDGAYIVGGTEEQRVSLRESLAVSSAFYRSWSGRSPPMGVIRLDKRLPLTDDLVGHAKWVLTYDKERAPHFSQTDAQASKAVSSQSISRSSRKIRGISSERHIISHEICHKYVSYLYREAHGAKARIPDAANEIAAISCESEEAIYSRLTSFAPAYFTRSYLPWSKFLESSHPLKSARFINKIKQLAKKGNSPHIVVAFNSHSALSSKIDEFYGQAAVFALLLRSRYCGRYSAVGWLIEKYNAKSSFSNWLASNRCLPQTPDKFDHEVNKIMSERQAHRISSAAQQHKVKSLADHPGSSALSEADGN